ncbi:MAG: chemotaxis protein, partial [Acinetobacter sp.]|nr:chemotaxis protein [Acinetobacter sp.]
SQSEILKDDSFAQQLMNGILSAMNSIGVLERHHTSSRLQLRVNNMNISLDRLDEAHEALLNETKKLIDLSSQALVQHVKDQDAAPLEAVPVQLREIGGALLFLNAESGQEALSAAAGFLQERLDAAAELKVADINNVLDTLASADMLIDNLKSKQPVLHAMFKVALDSSGKLKSAA